MFVFQKTVGEQEQKTSDPMYKLYKKEEPVFRVIKKAKKENTTEEQDRLHKKLKTDLESHYKKSPETLKTLRKIYENKRLKILLSYTIIVDIVDTGTLVDPNLRSHPNLRISKSDTTSG